MDDFYDLLSQAYKPRVVNGTKIYSVQEMTNQAIEVQNEMREISLKKQFLK